MKTTEQLIELSRNPYYEFSPEEKKRLNAFLAKKSEQSTPAKSSGKNSEQSTRATVHNKNRVAKEVGDVPIINGSTEKHSAEVAELEDVVHPDAV